MIGAHQPKNKSRAWLAISFRWAAALVILAILFYFLPVAPLRAALARVPPIRFAIILVLYLCAHAVGVFKWRMTPLSTPMTTRGKSVLGKTETGMLKAR